MNKEFRAWDGKKMLSPDDFWLSADGVAAQFGDDGHIYLTHYPLMQWTGLYDRNRVKVFEGDIVIHHLLQGEKYTAFFDERKAKFSLKDKDTCWGVDSLEASKYCEVIGNEFQHSELLKEAE